MGEKKIDIRRSDSPMEITEKKLMDSIEDQKKQIDHFIVFTQESNEEYK
jgi:hypothetical protein